MLEILNELKKISDRIYTDEYYDHDENGKVINCLEIALEISHKKGKRDNSFEKSIEEIVKDYDRTEILTSHNYSEKYDGYIGVTFSIINLK